MRTVAKNGYGITTPGGEIGIWGIFVTLHYGVVPDVGATLSMKPDYGVGSFGVWG